MWEFNLGSAHSVLMRKWSCIFWPGHTKQVEGGRKTWEKEIPGSVDAARLRGGRWGSGFSLTGGLGEGLVFWNIRRCIQGTVDIKPRCFALTSWVQSTSWGPALDSTWRIWRVWLHGATSLWEHTLNTPLIEPGLLRLFTSHPSSCMSNI